MSARFEAVLASALFALAMFASAPSAEAALPADAPVGAKARWADHLWTRKVDVREVVVEVTVGGVARRVSGGLHFGQATLFRNKTTDEFRCEVVLASNAPAHALEHELAHCRGWVH